jgi:hypothetical protein
VEHRSPDRETPTQMSRTASGADYTEDYEQDDNQSNISEIIDDEDVENA